MKCVNCGCEYFSKETLDSGVCPACGKSLTVTDPTYAPSASTVSWPKPNPLGFDPALGVDAAVSSAINTRRIALVLILGVVLSVGSVLVSLIISIFLTSSYDETNLELARVLLLAWLIIAAAILIFGLYYIIFKKRLSRF